MKSSLLFLSALLWCIPPAAQATPFAVLNSIDLDWLNFEANQKIYQEEVMAIAKHSEAASLLPAGSAEQTWRKKQIFRKLSRLETSFQRQTTVRGYSIIPLLPSRYAIQLGNLESALKKARDDNQNSHFENLQQTAQKISAQIAKGVIL